MLKHLKATEDWSDKNAAQKGFTLIELLVVIAVLGILAVVGVLAFGGITQSAKDKTDKTELSEVKTAAKAYQAETGNPATAVTELGAYVTTDDLRCDYTFVLGVPAQTAGTCDHS